MGRESAIDTYLALRAGLDSWTEPAAPALSPATAARVSLYLGGRAVGARTVPHDPSGGAVGVAARQAMEAALQSLLPRRDATWRERVLTLSPELFLSVEIAGPMTPLSPSELANPDAALRPGIDGLAARVEGEWLVLFPSEQAHAGTTPAVEYPAMAARLLADPLLGVELTSDLAGKHGMAFYRFEATHVAGVGEGGAPRVLTRGQLPVEPGEITVASLVAYAGEMLSHLESRRHDPATRLGLAGTIHPLRGVADPLIAPPTQQALVMLALLNLAETPQAEESVRERARGLARALAVDLAHVDEREIAPEDDGVAAAVLWVVLDRLEDARESEPAVAGLFESCEALMARHVAAPPAEPRGSVSEAVVVWSLAERAARTGRDRDRAEADLRALLAVSRPGLLVGSLPWLGWAEVRLHPEGELPGGAALRQAREQVWAHQLTEDDTGREERDLSGGIIFTEGFVSLPTWSAARPVAFLATMLGDPRLTTPSERPMETVRLLRVMRFFRQLGAGPVQAPFYPDAGRSVGGVRAAPWDHRMPPQATAMTLLSVTEFLRALALAEGAG